MISGTIVTAFHSFLHLWAIIALPVGGGVLFGGEVLALLQGYPGAQLPGYLPVLHCLPGDGALPLLVTAALVQLVLVVWLQLCLLGTLWSPPSTSS